MNNEYIHFDSINLSTKNNDVFNGLYILPNSYRHIKSINLKNIEIPLSFPNIRASNLSNTLRFSINSTLYTTTIIEKNYTSIATLITDLNTALNTTLTSSGFTMVLSLGTTNNLIITLTGSLTNLTINKTTLSLILGISEISTNSLIYTSTKSFNIGYDTYILMSFDNIPSINTSNNFIRSAFKIPLNTNYGNINYYFSHRSENEQSLVINDSNFIFNKLNVIFFDRFGYLLTNYNVDYSFSISINSY